MRVRPFWKQKSEKSSKNDREIGSTASREKARKVKADNAAKINFKRLVNRRRGLHEIPSRTIAVKNFCRECVGWDSGGLSSVAANIQACPAKECWLYPYRNGGVEASEP